ncbi:MAG: hypothetical protein KatS3mg045_0148 [Bellilinea sp.]|nr:MAG: hypothetical protein KatS3mg045_0148 [Bellilinea sp.]
MGRCRQVGMPGFALQAFLTVMALKRCCQAGGEVSLVVEISRKYGGERVKSSSLCQDDASAGAAVPLLK